MIVHIQFIKFVIIGVFSTVINYASFYALLNFFDVNYMTSSAAGFILGVFTGYWFNKFWTFEVSDNSKNFVAKYFIVYVISLVLGLLFLRFLVRICGLSPEIANVLMIGLTTCTNFLGTKFLVFKK